VLRSTPFRVLFSFAQGRVRLRRGCGRLCHRRSLLSVFGFGLRLLVATCRGSMWRARASRRLAKWAGSAPCQGGQASGGTAISKPS
jgi:hypothetical protein